jgi:Cof subfamily protein (haloacid dehalogenase superfamily)
MAAAGCCKIQIPGDPKTLEPLVKLLEDYSSSATMYFYKPHLLEILPPGVDKGSALAFLTEKLSIPREAVMAFGDSMNDESMLRWAGHSVAMINGDSRLKEIAAIITDKTNDEDGVAEVIERYVLGDESVAGTGV